MEKKKLKHFEDENAAWLNDKENLGASIRSQKAIIKNQNEASEKALKDILLSSKTETINNLIQAALVAQASKRGAEESLEAFMEKLDGHYQKKPKRI